MAANDLLISIIKSKQEFTVNNYCIFKYIDGYLLIISYVNLQDCEENSTEFKTENTTPPVLKTYKSKKSIRSEASSLTIKKHLKANRLKLTKNKNVETEKKLILTSDEKKKRKRKGNEGICSTCGKFATNIYTHIRIHDTIQHTFECDYCQKLFTNKYSLLQHFRIHFNERFVF